MYNDMILQDLRISDYGAKLLREFSVGSSPLNNQYFKGRNRTAFNQLASVIGLKTLTLPIIFEGTDRHDVALKKSTFEGDAYGKVEMWLPDGFFYTVMLDGSTEPENIGDKACKATYTFVGLQHDILSETVGNSIYCTSTVFQTDCILTVTVGATSTAYKLWNATFDVSAGDVITFDGYNKRILINGAPGAQNATWTEFPYLTRGENTIQCVDTVTIQYYPTYM